MDHARYRRELKENAGQPGNVARRAKAKRALQEAEETDTGENANENANENETENANENANKNAIGCGGGRQEEGETPLPSKRMRVAETPAATKGGLKPALKRTNHDSANDPNVLGVSSNSGKGSGKASSSVGSSARKRKRVVFSE